MQTVAVSGQHGFMLTQMFHLSKAISKLCLWKERWPITRKWSESFASLHTPQQSHLTKT